MVWHRGAWEQQVEGVSDPASFPAPRSGSVGAAFGPTAVCGCLSTKVNEASPQFRKSYKPGCQLTKGLHIPHFIEQAVHLTNQALVFLLKLRGNKHSKDDIILNSSLKSNAGKGKRPARCLSRNLWSVLHEWGDMALPEDPEH